jgi:hypothetical protein
LGSPAVKGQCFADEPSRSPPHDGYQQLLLPSYRKLSSTLEEIQARRISPKPNKIHAYAKRQQLKARATTLATKCCFFSRMSTFYYTRKTAVIMTQPTLQTSFRGSTAKGRSCKETKLSCC